MVEGELPQDVLWPHCANCGTHTHMHTHTRAYARTRVHAHTYTKYVHAGELQKTARTVLFISSLPLHRKSGKHRLFPLERNLAESSWETSSLAFTAPWMRDEARGPHRVTWPYLPLLGTLSRKLEERDIALFLIQMVQWRKKDLLRWSCSRRFYFPARLHMKNT